MSESVRAEQIEVEHFRATPRGLLLSDLGAGKTPVLLKRAMEILDAGGPRLIQWEAK